MRMYEIKTKYSVKPRLLLSDKKGTVVTGWVKKKGVGSMGEGEQRKKMGVTRNEGDTEAS